HRRRRPGGIGHVEIGDPDELFEADPLQGVDVGLGLASAGDTLGDLTGQLPVHRALCGEHLEQVPQEVLEEVAASEGRGRAHSSNAMRATAPAGLVPYAASAPSVARMGQCPPLRTTSSITGAPGRRSRSAPRRSRIDGTGWPSTASMMSWGNTPAAAAGLLLCTFRTWTPPGVLPPPGVAGSWSSAEMPSHARMTLPLVTSWSAASSTRAAGAATQCAPPPSPVVSVVMPTTLPDWSRSAPPGAGPGGASVSMASRSGGPPFRRTCWLMPFMVPMATAGGEPTGSAAPTAMVTWQVAGAGLASRLTLGSGLATRRTATPSSSSSP